MLNITTLYTSSCWLYFIFWNSWSCNENLKTFAWINIQVEYSHVALMKKLYTYDISSILNCRSGAVYTGSKWTETMFIWWCHGYQSHIYVNDSTPKQVGNFAQEYWDCVRSAFIDSFPGIGTEKKRVWSEDSCKSNRKLTTIVCSNIKKSCSTRSFDFKQAGPVVFTDNFF